MDAEDLAVGDVVFVDGQPCLVTDVESSGGGKHGTAKVTASTVGLYDGEEHALAQPADAAVETVDVAAGPNPLVLVRADEEHFDPPIVRVAPGQKVVWLWDDGAEHEVRAADGSFASDRTAGEGYAFEHTFDAEGHYRYDCGAHGATGVVLVADD